MKKQASKTTTTTVTTAPVEAAPVTTAPVKAKSTKAKAAKASKTNKPNMVTFHHGLEHKYGFSISAVRDTLNQLKTLGLPTDAVKKQLIQRFTDYVNKLDK